MSRPRPRRLSERPAATSSWSASIAPRSVVIVNRPSWSTRSMVSAGLDPDALVGEDLLDQLARLRLLRGQQPVGHLEHRHLRARTGRTPAPARSRSAPPPMTASDAGSSATFTISRLVQYGVSASPSIGSRRGRGADVEHHATRPDVVVLPHPDRARRRRAAPRPGRSGPRPASSRSTWESSRQWLVACLSIRVATAPQSGVTSALPASSVDPPRLGRARRPRGSSSWTGCSRRTGTRRPRGRARRRRRRAPPRRASGRRTRLPGPGPAPPRPRRRSPCAPPCQARQAGRRSLLLVVPGTAGSPWSGDLTEPPHAPRRRAGRRGRAARPAAPPRGDPAPPAATTDPAPSGRRVGDPQRRRARGPRRLHRPRLRPGRLGLGARPVPARHRPAPSSRRSCSRPTPPRSPPRSPTTATGSSSTPTPRCTTGTCWRRRYAARRRRTSAARWSEIALTDSTTMGMAVMYGGLDLQPGDEILTTTHDFFSTEDALRLVVAAHRRPGPRGSPCTTTRPPRPSTS